jgi:23S rRNA (cytosine1962-C5)-methyltransferase
MMQEQSEVVPRDLRVVSSPGFPDYVLLDSGGRRKLERFGAFTIERPEPQALWRPSAPADVWRAAQASFESPDAEDDGNAGRWSRRGQIPDSWPVQVHGVSMLCKLSGFRHLGLFPEQEPHWRWMLDWLRPAAGGGPPRVLNLFAYTGAASLLAAKNGAEVTHVDASKKAIGWAKENQAASGLASAPVRWILDDARKFVARETRRGRTYDLILVDPPKFGRGPDGEVWDIFEHLPSLLQDCATLLVPGRSALLLTTYAIRASALAMDGLVRDCLQGRKGQVESGELAIVEQSAGRLLPTSLFTRWVSDDTAA